MLDDDWLIGFLLFVSFCALCGSLGYCKGQEDGRLACQGIIHNMYSPDEQ